MTPANAFFTLFLTCGLTACAVETDIDSAAPAFIQNDSENTSEVISSLLDRRSLLENPSPYSTVLMRFWTLRYAHPKPT